jgi:hypothetical protein
MQRKKKIALVALALIATVATASAAMLEYYGRITSTVTVSQAVVFDDKTYPNLEVTEDVSGAAGRIIRGGDHWLRNDASVRILVELVSNNSIAYPEFRLEPACYSDHYDGDEDAVHFYLSPMTWANFQKVAFDFVITSGPSERPPYVNIWLKNSTTHELDCVTTFNGGNPQPEITESPYGFKTAVYTKDKFVWAYHGGSIPDDLIVWEVTIESGNGSAANTNNDLQVVYVSKVKINDTPLSWVILPLQSNYNIPTRIVEFRMAYYFSPLETPETYAITTTVLYRGTVTADGEYSS